VGFYQEINRLADEVPVVHSDRLEKGSLGPVLWNDQAAADHALKGASEGAAQVLRTRPGVTCLGQGGGSRGHVWGAEDR
jgi:hypothetical protein